MRLSLQIALRFSRIQRRRMVSLISIISTIGIILGVAVPIIGLSAMNGFERELNNRILAIVPHVEIEPVESPFTDWHEALKRLKKIPGFLAAAPYLSFTGLIEYNDKVQAIQIKGIDPALEAQLSALPRYIHDNGVWSRFQANQQQIIIGKGVANMLQVKPGDWLTVIIPNRDYKMNLLQLKHIRLQVSGILVVNSQLDNNFAIVPLADAQRYLQCGADIDGIAIRVSDIFNTNKLVRNVGEVINTHVEIHSWIDTYGYMYRDIQMIRIIIYLAMIFIVGVACFNIVSTLIMAVKDKSADIAILRTLGAKDGLIRAIFIWYGLLVGLIGSVCGAGSGILIALNLTTLVKWIEQWLGHQLLSSDVYFIDFLPTELYWLDVICVLVTGVLLSILASWYPAWRATHIEPAKVLGGQ